MNLKVTITPANLDFITDNETNILASALLAKINLPHGCKSGNCGACKCKITSGTVTHEIDTNPSTLTEEEISQGYSLLCKAHATSDVVIELAGFTNSLPIKTLPSKITSIDKQGTTAIVKLKLPAGQKFDFYAGQYIDILYAEQSRSYSLANSPTVAGELELHIRHRPGGLFSEAIWNDLAVDSLVRFKGPLGNFTLQDNQKPILMICTGTGFAPVKAILEYMIATGNKRSVHLIWGNFVTEDFYLTELLDAWKTQLNLTTTLCVNENAPTNYTTGLVTDLIAKFYPDVSSHEIYACGNPKMIESLYTLAADKLNLTENSFFSDSFTPSK